MTYSATVLNGIGRTPLGLPENVKMRVVATAGLGSTQPHDLQWNGEAYVNAAYG
jgi:hypothetical protein